ncbi:alpha/beta hydrolase [Shewanella sp. AS1]|uniref:alpha/beta fold hydrolase n=1 Tax=Shewanella sp. AS1 TaxID=2907626 RepID=UPI001F1AC415|nr:alpha/beta fold hydrolase [Shewanella sp. AS1]MCE9680611.1 alpha/beta hydrolase [Shewanella sp. AS1]
MSSLAVHPLIRQDWLDVGDGHRLFLAQYGDPQGVPVLYLHGGPGDGCSGDELTLFTDKDVHIYMLDQRGAGRSRPCCMLTNNDLLSLLQDIERVRRWSEVERWCLLGGSFGATLGYLYSCIYPARVLSQVYWGMFIPSAAGMRWLYGDRGAAQLFPEAYQCFNPQGAPDLAALFEQFEQGFNHAKADVREEFLQRWLNWELTLAQPQRPVEQPIFEPSRVLARLELHYARHHYFGAYPLLKKVAGELQAPTVILQGEQDWVCPAQLVDDFLTQYGPAKLACRLVTLGGHSFTQEDMGEAIAQAVRQMVRYVKCL